MQGGPRIKQIGEVEEFIVSSIQYENGTVSNIVEKWIERSPRYWVFWNKWDPGAMTPSHGHHGDHTVYVLSGEITHLRDGKTYGADTHIMLEYGDTFGPWLAGPNGATLLGMMAGGVGPGGTGHSFRDDPDGWQRLLAERKAKVLPISANLPF